MGIDFEAWKHQREERGSRYDENYLFAGRRDGITEQCQFCDSCYHPMPRYTRGDQLIFVCHHRFSEDNGNLQILDSPCKARAETDGWIFRRDLTPRR